MIERREALWRILVLIVSGIVLALWNNIMGSVILLHWFYAVITGKRNKTLARFNNFWASFAYRFYRYVGFSTNLRPWPFEEFGKAVEKPDMRKRPPKK